MRFSAIFYCFLAVFKDNDGMYEYFHRLILLNGHYTSNNVELGVFNVQLVSKTSEEGPVQILFHGRHMGIPRFLEFPN